MENLLNAHGKRFTAIMGEKSITGRVIVDSYHGNPCIFLAQDFCDGANPDNGNPFSSEYKYTWWIGNGDNLSLLVYNIKEFKLEENPVEFKQEVSVPQFNKY